MVLGDIPLFDMLKTRMHWHQERQRVLAENVANADTPGYRGRDMAPLDFRSALAATASPAALSTTSAGHLPGLGGADGRLATRRAAVAEVRPSGNAVVLEDEMLKVAQNQMDYQAATSLYGRGLGLLKTALGRRG